MNRITAAVLTLAACGAILTLCDRILPGSGVRKAAKAAIGLLFLLMIAEQITGILT